MFPELFASSEPCQNPTFLRESPLYPLCLCASVVNEHSSYRGQWPWLVCVEAGHAYVGDRLNRRVVAVKLDYAAEEVCPVK